MPHELIIATIFSSAIAFFLALKSGSNKYSIPYMDVVIGSWGKIIFTILPIILYSIVGILRGGWDPLFKSGEFALAAALISGLGIQEMCCGIAIKHDRELSRAKISFVSIGALLIFSISLTSMVYLYITSESGLFIFIFQLFLFAISIFTYFATGAVMSMVEQNISQTRKQ